MSSANKRPTDPLIESEGVDRVHYATGVMLDASDFLDEQSYHRSRLARALAYLHGSGTAAGLKVSYDKSSSVTSDENDEIQVLPGLAVDALGRLIEVPVRCCIRVRRWYEGYEPNQLNVYQKGSTGTFSTNLDSSSLPGHALVADLFLRFYACERGKTPAFVAGPFDATDAVVASRRRDGYELRLVVRTEQVPPSPPDTIPLPPPVPASPFPSPSTIADPSARRAALQEAIFSAWTGGREATLKGLMPRLPAELCVSDGKEESDPAWVFLARLIIGTHASDKEKGSDQKMRPARTREVWVDNSLRPFAVSAAALARWMDI